MTPSFGYTVLGFGSGVSGGVFTTATGGTVSTDGDTKIHTFDSSGDFIISLVGEDDDQVSVELAGGGSGGVGSYNASPTTLSATGSGGNTTAQGLTANGASGASGSGSGASGQAFGTQGSISGNGGGSKNTSQIGCGAGGQGNTGSGGGAGGYKTGGGSVTLGHAGYAAAYASDLDFTGTVATRAVVIGAGSSGTGNTDGGCNNSPSNSAGAKGGDGQVVFKYTYQ